MAVFVNPEPWFFKPPVHSALHEQCIFVLRRHLGDDPGLTGINVLNTELSAKRVQLLHEI